VQKAWREPLDMTDLSLPTARVGKYRILAHIATGGMGSVYKARDEGLDRVVALKVLAPELSDNEVVLERFRREAKHAAKLSHRNIVTLYECGEDQGLHFLAMEFVEGIDLGDYIKRRNQLQPNEARRILKQACKALDHAHSQGLTHRDIKPSNFLLARENDVTVVKLTDFGLARNANDKQFRVTRDGTTVGTVDYLSPEQARDSDLADVRSDIYSLGCTFYHMLAGRPPFSEGGLGERIYKHLASEPQDVRELNPEVPATLWTILKKMLAKVPDARYQTPAEVLHDLRKPQGDMPFVPLSEEDTVQDEAEGQPAALHPATPAPDRRQRKRPSSITELTVLTAAQKEALGLTPEQQQAAAGQFERAQEVMQTDNLDYALQLLLNCCKLDPTELKYRRALRNVVKSLAKDKKPGGWLSGLSLGGRSGRQKLRNAKRAGDFRTVLGDGEECLVHSPGDVGVQLDMAESAATLGLNGLTIWLLEKARQAEPANLHILRALAKANEDQRRFLEAMAIWETIHKTDPTDADASRKIQELAVNATLGQRNK
jgi:serine/threonine protein kinase